MRTEDRRVPGPACLGSVGAFLFFFFLFFFSSPRRSIESEGAGESSPNHLQKRASPQRSSARYPLKEGRLPFDLWELTTRHTKTWIFQRS